MTFAEPVWRYKNALTFSKTSPVSPLDIQVLVGRLGRNRRKREEEQGSRDGGGWRRLERSMSVS